METLAATPFVALAERFDPAKMSEQDIYPQRRFWDEGDLGYLRYHHSGLVEFFTVAAASGSAAIRSFSF